MKTIQELIKEELKMIEDCNRSIQAWNSVVIKTREDGSEYKVLSNRCIEGGYIDRPSYEEDTVRKCLNASAYPCWSINCYGYCRDLPDGDPRKTPDSIRYSVYALTPAEMRSEIARRIEQIESEIQEHNEAIQWLEHNEDSIEEMLSALTDGVLKEAETIERYLFHKLKELFEERINRYYP